MIKIWTQFPLIMYKKYTVKPPNQNNCNWDSFFDLTDFYLVQNILIRTLLKSFEPVICIFGMFRLNIIFQGSIFKQYFLFYQESLKKSIENQ